MNAILTAAALAITLAGCATQKPSDRDHAAHHPQGGPPGRILGTICAQYAE